MSSQADHPSHSAQKVAKGNSFFMNTENFREYTSAYILATVTDPVDKQLRLVKAEPCPISPASVESALFPARSTVFKDAPKLVYLTSHEMDSVMGSLPPWLSEYRWLDYAECAVYRDFFLSVIYNGLFRYVRSRINNALLSREWLNKCQENPMERLARLKEGCIAHLEYDLGTKDVFDGEGIHVEDGKGGHAEELGSGGPMFGGCGGRRSNKAPGYEGTSGGYGHFLMSVVARRLREVIFPQVNQKKIGEMLLNPIGPYHIRRLLNDYNSDIDVSFVHYLIQNLPHDTPCGLAAHKRREHVMRMTSKTSVTEYNTVHWKLMFSHHLKAVCKLWKTHTNSGTLKTILDDTEGHFHDMWRILTDFADCNSTYLINIAYGNSFTLFDQICRFNLSRFCQDYHNLHAPWFSIPHFLQKYSILLHGHRKTKCRISLPSANTPSASTPATHSPAANSHSSKDRFPKRGLEQVSSETTNRSGSRGGSDVARDQSTNKQQASKESAVVTNITLNVPTRVGRDRRGSVFDVRGAHTSTTVSSGVSQFARPLPEVLGTIDPVARVGAIMATIKTGRATEFTIQNNRVYIHPQTMGQLEHAWLGVIAARVVRIQAIWRGSVVRRNYQALKKANMSIKCIQHAFAKATAQQWNYFEPPVFPDCRDGQALYITYL
ncbi:hypothetical protein GNI_061560 [Gregarina niphandrodes]|uniref:Uncharacterized protein n=1 Tax=Gregarina niphandrodes TaxID=110365 RepID=A0A023B890_GRENI|nr:hypothetical protein GNI_061560 [Gregarina niphandrodes]EZG68711.1 hypothetical protein GNI_061560 [Gregarina niphandrodes]|eukprot:XP_011134555.1 hypothetical protein GNI_061560 [Gregarina niphandrodes]